jgi:hypothetical protein
MQIRESTRAGGPTEAGGVIFISYFSFVLCLSLLVHMCIFVRSSFSWPRVHRGGWHAAPESTEACGMQSRESTEAGGPTVAGGLINN